MAIIVQERSGVGATLNDFRLNFNSLSAIVGDYDSLNGSPAETLIESINAMMSDIGILSSLDTTNKSSLVSAVNELHTEIGSLGTLSQQNANSVSITGGSITGLSTFTVAANIVPTSDNSRDLGAVGAEFKDIYSTGVINADKIVLSNASAEGFGSDLYPTTDNAYDLGVNGRGWRNLDLTGQGHMHKLHLSTTAGDGVASNMQPTVNGGWTLGSTSYRWGTIYVNNIDVLTSLVPTTDNSVNIGSTSYYFNNAYVQQVNLGQAATAWGAYLWGAHNGSNYYEFQLTLGNSRSPLYVEGGLDGQGSPTQCTLSSANGVWFFDGISQSSTSTATTGSIALQPFVSGVWITTQGAGNITYTLDYTTGRIASRDYKCPSFTLIIIPNSTYSVTWFTGTSAGAIKWAEGSAPTLTTGTKYLIQFMSPDNGVTWIGSVPVEYT